MVVVAAVGFAIVGINVVFGLLRSVGEQMSDAE